MNRVLYFLDLAAEELELLGSTDVAEEMDEFAQEVRGQNPFQQKTLQELSEQLDIDVKLLRKVLLGLQGAGKLACRIDRGTISVLSVLAPHPGTAAQRMLAAGPSPPELATEGDFVYCPFCGAKNPEKAIFCKNCGQAFQ